MAIRIAESALAEASTKSSEHLKYINANLPGVRLIIEMTSATMSRRGKQLLRAYYFSLSMRAMLEPLLGLTCQSWSIEANSSALRIRNCKTFCFLRAPR